jgi:hypothetical protein
MNAKRKRLLISFMAIALFCAPVFSFAQEDCYDPDINPGGNPDNPCPIDGGLSLLIAAGIGLGAKKAYDSKKKEKNVDYKI